MKKIGGWGIVIGLLVIVLTWWYPFPPEWYLIGLAILLAGGISLFAQRWFQSRAEEEEGEEETPPEEKRPLAKKKGGGEVAQQGRKPLMRLSGKAVAGLGLAAVIGCLALYGAMSGLQVRPPGGSPTIVPAGQEEIRVTERRILVPQGARLYHTDGNLAGVVEFAGGQTAEEAIVVEDRGDGFFHIRFPSDNSEWLMAASEVRATGPAKPSPQVYGWIAMIVIPLAVILSILIGWKVLVIWRTPFLANPGPIEVWDQEGNPVGEVDTVAEVKVQTVGGIVNMVIPPLRRRTLESLTAQVRAACTAASREGGEAQVRSLAQQLPPILVRSAREAGVRVTISPPERFRPHPEIERATAERMSARVGVITAATRGWALRNEVAAAYGVRPEEVTQQMIHDYTGDRQRLSSADALGTVERLPSLVTRVVTALLGGGQREE